MHVTNRSGEPQEIDGGAPADQQVALTPSQRKPGETGSVEGRKQLSEAVLRRRWDLALAHRDELLAIARRRVPNRQDAEDVVATALLRTVESATLDEARIGRFLCSTVVRLAADVHRDRARQLAVGKRQAARELSPVPAEEVLCDEAEARWLEAQLLQCPERELQVLQARLAGRTGSELAADLGLSVKAAENAYTRLRQRAHKILAATAAAVGVVAGLGRRTAPATGLAVPVALAALVLGVSFGPQEAPVDVAPRVAVPGSTEVSGTAPPGQPAGAGEVVSARPREAPRAATAAEAPVDTSQPRDGGRAVVIAPQDAAPRLINGGSVYVDGQAEYEEEDFATSVQRCVAGLNVGDPLADPCE